MSFASAPFASRFTRVVVLWLLAIVLPLQGAAVGIFGALGPAHVHKAADAPLVLEDVRRWKPAPRAQAHVFTAFGHFHASATPQRHHHAVDDGSVVRTDADAADADEAPGASAVSVLALIPSMTMQVPSSAAAERNHGPLWAASTGFVHPPERPPRPA